MLHREAILVNGRKTKYFDNFPASSSGFNSSLSAALLAIQAPVGNLIAAFGRMWAGFFMNAGWAICFLSVAHGLLALGWGAQALACAYLAAYLVHAVWTFWFAATLLRPSQRFSTVAPTGVVALDAQSL